jgi:hypothetical protein
LSINQYILFTLTKTLYYNEALELVKEKLSKTGNKVVSSILDKIPEKEPLEGDKLCKYFQIKNEMLVKL